MQHIHLISRIVLALATTFLAAVPAYSCEIADVLFGGTVSLEIINHKASFGNYETAIIRHSDFNDKRYIHGAIRGEIGVERNGFSVKNVKGEVVGIISPSLQIESWGDDCDNEQKSRIMKVQNGVYVIMNGNVPVGNVEGRFPENSFGVR